MPFDNTDFEIPKTTIAPSPVSSRIFAALCALEDRGWVQDAYEDDDGRVCLLRAFEISGGRQDTISKAAIRKVANLAGCNKYMDLICYNDHLVSITGKYAIIDLLNRAIAECEGA
jgi:hypothetical protein